MFSKYVPRLLRRAWGAIGTSHLSDTKPEDLKPQDAYRAVQGHGVALNQLVEELASMFEEDVPLYHEAPTQVVVDGASVPDHLPGTDFWSNQPPLIFQQGDYTGYAQGSNFGLNNLGFWNNSQYANLQPFFGLSSVNNVSEYNVTTGYVEGGYSQYNIGASYFDQLIGGSIWSNNVYNLEGDRYLVIDTPNDQGLVYYDGDTNTYHTTISPTTNYNFFYFFNNIWTLGVFTEVTYVTDIRYDSTSHKFQKKTRTGYVLAPGTESAWTDVHTAVLLSTVTRDVNWVSPALKQNYTSTVYVLEKGTDTNDEVIDTAETCV